MLRMDVGISTHTLVLQHQTVVDQTWGGKRQEVRFPPTDGVLQSLATPPNMQLSIEEKFQGRSIS